MKIKIHILLIFLLIFTNLSFAKVNELIKPLYSFFPQISEMEGGDSRWIATDTIEDIKENYILLKKSYSSFNKNPEKIWQIQRKKSFKVDIEIYYAKNFIVAKSIYEEKLKRKVKYKKRVGFGDIGTMLIEPDKHRYPDADYELVFIDKNFVISLRSTDGFALMDFADYIENAISVYILNNFDKFFIKNLSISVSAGEYGIKTEQIDFVAENLKQILIEGRVFDNKNRPIAFANVEIKDFNLKTQTDEDGYYRFVLKFNGKKKISLTKNFFLKSAVSSSDKKDVKIYHLTVDYKINSMKKDNIFLKVENNFALIKFDSKIDKALKFRASNNNIHFVRDCSGGSSFRCIQIFDGKIADGKITGTWKGTGGGGKWFAELLDLKTKEVFVTGKYCKLSQVELDKNKDISNQSDDLIVSYGYDYNKYIYLECKFDKIDKFFNNKIKLKLTHLSSVNKNKKDLFLYYVKRDVDRFKFIQSKKAASLFYSEEPYVVQIDLSDFVSNNQTNYFLLGILSNSSDKGEHKFANSFNYKLIRPKIEFSDFALPDKANKITKVTKIVSISSEKDYASNSNKVKPDGKKDLNIKISNIYKDGTIKFIEIKNTGDFPFRWNTDNFDIYPGIVLFVNGKKYTSNNSNFNLKVKKGDILDIYLYKPEEINEKNIKLSYKFKIDNEWYSGNIN